MAPTKTAGGQEPSKRFLRSDAAHASHRLPGNVVDKQTLSKAKGLGAENAPAHKEAAAPGAAPVASDSGLPIEEAKEEEAAAGTGNLTDTNNDVGTEGLKAARPGGAAKGPNLAGPA